MVFKNLFEEKKVFLQFDEPPANNEDVWVYKIKEGRDKGNYMVKISTGMGGWKNPLMFSGAYDNEEIKDIVDEYKNKNYKIIGKI